MAGIAVGGAVSQSSPLASPTRKRLRFIWRKRTFFHLVNRNFGHSLRGGISAIRSRKSTFLLPVRTEDDILIDDSHYAARYNLAERISGVLKK